MLCVLDSMLIYLPTVGSKYAKSELSIVKSPDTLGIMRYSAFLVPLIPMAVLLVDEVIFGSYTSKSGGKTGFGSSNNSIFPLPDTVNVKVMPSLTLSSVLSTLEVNVNCPTAPLKLFGLFVVGKGSTSIVSGCDLISFLTLVYEVPKTSSKKSSNGSYPCGRVFCWRIWALQLISRGSIVSLPVFCGNNTISWMVPTLYCLPSLIIDDC